MEISIGVGRGVMGSVQRGWMLDGKIYGFTLFLDGDSISASIDLLHLRQIEAEGTSLADLALDPDFAIVGIQDEFD
jgi:hypothetical protein